MEHKNIEEEMADLLEEMVDGSGAGDSPKEETTPNIYDEIYGISSEDTSSHTVDTPADYAVTEPTEDVNGQEELSELDDLEDFEEMDDLEDSPSEEQENELTAELETGGHYEEGPDTVELTGVDDLGHFDGHEGNEEEEELEEIAEEELEEEIVAEVYEDEEYEEEIVYVDEEGNPISEYSMEEMGIDDVNEAINHAVMYQNVSYTLTGKDGKDLPSRVNGDIDIEILPIDEIKVPKRVREDSDTYNLEESIRKFGQLTPVHVVRYGEYYILLDGYLRLKALTALGQDTVTAMIDSTIVPELTKYYSVIVNSSKPYKFSEFMAYVKFVQETQPTLGVTAIEGILGMPPGELLKAMYVDSLKVDYPEPYQQLELGKINIEQAFKRVEKEIQKAEKENTDGVDALNSGEMDDQLRNVDELANMNNDAGTQDVEKRRILDPLIRRVVEARDSTQCQACGFGHSVPEFNGALKAHHIIAVMYGGSDNTSNLILLCNNCHEMVHDYEKGRFIPTEEVYNEYAWVQRVVVLGNMLQKMRTDALAIIRKKHENTARLVDRGKLGLGKAIKKHDILLQGEEYYGGSPYQTYIDATSKLRLGGKVVGELGVVQDQDVSSDIDEQEEPTE